VIVTRSVMAFLQESSASGGRRRRTSNMGTF
jgi:hypothetical protein